MLCCFALLGSARIYVAVQTTLPHQCRTKISPVSRGSPSTDKMGTRSLKSSPAVGVHCKWLAVPNQIFSDEPSQFTLHLSIQSLTWNHRSCHTTRFCKSYLYLKSLTTSCQCPKPSIEVQARTDNTNSNLYLRLFFCKADERNFDSLYFLLKHVQSSEVLRIFRPPWFYTESSMGTRQKPSTLTEMMSLSPVPNHNFREQRNVTEQKN